MPQRSGVQLLFVPCSANGFSHPSSEDEAQLSWQKHASRQYHQRNKLARPQLPRMSRAARRAARTPFASVREIQAKSSTFSDVSTGDELYKSRVDAFSPIGDVACNQLDPFGVIIRPDTPKYAIEILQHGMYKLFTYQGYRLA